ncbi:MAG TPA: FtsW/RodA/SpoVE family cell cycle protein [Phycisphaerae bacterium]|nr:FtsW/RodA/SpoVE family cell cycle protein [Phycisphaerae bacterium]
MKSLRQILWKVLTTRVAWPILLTIALLCTASILALELSSPENADRQQIHILIASIAMVLMLLPHFQMVGRLGYALYGGGVLLLVAVLLAPVQQKTHRWFVLPHDVEIQPSEIMKIAYVIALAWYFRLRKDVRELRGLLIPFALTAIPFGLILIEPDLGTALLFPMVLYAMLVAAGARFRHLLAILLLAIIAIPGSFPFLKPYQQQRVISIYKQWTGTADESHYQKEGFQQRQSEIAIGAGGLTGQGAQAAQHIRQGLLWAAYTDFVFAVIGSQWGFVGCLLVLVLYLAFFAASMEIAGSTKDPFARLLVVGLASMILFQAMINMYMASGMAPVVGIALPFISYGGSSLLTNMIAAGLILSVSVRRSTYSVAAMRYAVAARA